MSPEPTDTTWRCGRFLIDRSSPPADDVLHLHCPGARDLAVEHLATLALLPIHDWNGVLLADAGVHPPLRADNTSACVFAIDPFHRTRDILEELRRCGYRWVTNFPSTEAIDGEMRATLDDLGFGREKELQFIEDAAAFGFAVAAFATSNGSAAAMIERGATLLVTPAGSKISVGSLPSAVPVIELEMNPSS